MIALPLLALARLQDAPIPADKALAYFAEVRSILERDHGALWGKPLDGPLLFVDPKTRAVVASRADAEGRLSPRGAAFAGTLPAAVNVANTATTWAGVKWSMVQWSSISPDPRDRARLLVHELFHRVQDQLGFPMASPANAHLDTLDGRMWLRLEWRAMRAALAADGDARRDAVADAAAFRAWRRSLATNAAAEENALELNEGLAEYTGLKLCGRGDAELRALLAKRIAGAEEQPSYVRSFAYETGPAYGLLLDDLGAGWRARLASNADLGALALHAAGRALPADLMEQADARAANYGGAEVRAEEETRERERAARLAEFRKRYVDGPVLVLPATDRLDYSYDPSTLQPFGERGTVYPTLRVSDAWGVLEVSGGALMSADFKRVIVPAPAAPPAGSMVEGPGWKLDLAPGWSLAKGERAGDLAASRPAAGR